ncbi:MAG: amidohydrolase family protein [Gemmatimonadaceae bacterium]
MLSIPHVVLLAGGLLAPLAAHTQTRPALAPAAREFVAISAPVVALTHVTLIDGTGAPPRADQTILLRDGKIAAVGPAGSLTIPDGAQVVVLNGHTVTPGFVGLHEHTYFNATTRVTEMSTSGPRLYLGNGVTTIRTAGSMFPYAEINMKRAIDRGEMAGPRMHITGPYLNGTAGAASLSRGLASEEEARRVVKYWGEEGATWLKFQGNVSRAILGAAIDEAHRHGMKVTGHLCSVTFREAAALGIDDLEHGLITNSDFVPGKQPDVCPPENMRVQVNVDLDGPLAREVQRDLLARKVALTSTLAVYETFVPGRAHLHSRAMEMLAPDTRAEVEAVHAALATDDFNVPQTLFAKMMRHDLAWFRAGGLLGAGVDPWGTGMLPGFGDLRNYEIFVEAGFTPGEAIQVMTLNGARILGEQASYGSVEAGKLADLVVIRGDITTRPASIYDIAMVFKDGIGYNSDKLIESSRGLVGIR